MQSWSRVDDLTRRSPDELGVFLKERKILPPLVGEKTIDKAAIDAR